MKVFDWIESNLFTIREGFLLPFVVDRLAHSAQSTDEAMTVIYAREMLEESDDEFIEDYFYYLLN